MTTLHLHVHVNDLAAWKAGYADHSETRRNAGVRAEIIRHPVGDPSKVLVDLDFDSAGEAETFLSFLRENVWKDQPILASAPQASILEAFEIG